MMLEWDTPLSVMMSLDWWTPGRIFNAVTFLIIVVWLLSSLMPEGKGK